MGDSCDVVIVGGGILGLSLAMQYRATYPDLKIAVIEKEGKLGAHGSGRNSGVLHSGVYYPSDSLKAKFSAEGAKTLREFCHAESLPIRQVGKVIVPTRSEDDSQLDMLLGRAKANGASAALIDEKQLKAIEPLALSASGRALHIPNSCVIDPRAILERMREKLTEQGVAFHMNTVAGSVRSAERKIVLRRLEGTGPTSTELTYGHLVNAAGAYADRLAHPMGVGKQFSIMPFKGLYFDLAHDLGNLMNGHIYPVPDLRLPFLGVHFTKSVTGKVTIGPNAIPALGRENYHRLEGIEPREASRILMGNLAQYLRNEQGFRALVHAEVKRLFKGPFVKAARELVPTVGASDMVRSAKVGIRAQLFDQSKQRLVMDFLVEQGPHSTHVLNAISPGFTCGPSFARHVVQTYPLS